MKCLGIFTRLALGAVLVPVLAPVTKAQQVSPYFNYWYWIDDLGHAPLIPEPYGAVEFMPGDPNHLLITGSANWDYGAIYKIRVRRDAYGHVNGFDGIAQYLGPAPYNDADFGIEPNTGAIFMAQWPVNKMALYPAGSFTPTKFIDLTPLGVAANSSSSYFVPSGYGTASGKLKVSSYPNGEIYDLTYSPDGGGLFNITAAQYKKSLAGGPVGFAYAPPSDNILYPGVLVSEFLNGEVAYYTVDADGDPVTTSRATVVSGLEAAEGACVDPTNGDYLFTTYYGGDRIVRMRKSNAVLTGDTDIQGREGSALKIYPVTFQLYQAGTQNLVQSLVGYYTNAEGDFEIGTSVFPGEYDIVMVGRRYLRNKINNVEITEAGANALHFVQFPGDIDEDNEVTLLDLSILSYCYGTVPGDPRWYPSADLNLDDEVNLVDYGLIAANFGMIGDE